MPVPAKEEKRAHANTRLLAALVCLLVALQVIVPYRGWPMLLAGFGGAWLVSYLWARSLAESLSLRREMRFGWAQVGDRLEERFTLRDDGSLPALWAEVTDGSDLPGYCVSRATGVGAYSENSWTTHGLCTRRGLFTLGPAGLRTGDPFGFYSVTIQGSARTTLLVLPPVVPLPEIEVAFGGRAGEGRTRSNAPERTVSAAGVRDYQPGDSLRGIHWRTSARHDSLYVRLLDGTPSGDWWVLLDMEAQAQAGQGQDSTEEHGVILAASLADRGLRMGRAVGLGVYGQDAVWLEPRAGDGQRWQILRSLALVSPGRYSLAEVLRRLGPAIGRRASLVIITSSVEGGWVEALLPLLRRDAVPTVLLLDRASFGGTGEAKGAAAILSDMGIARYVITRDMLDRPEARPGRRGHWEFRVSPGGRALAMPRSGDEAWRLLA